MSKSTRIYLIDYGLESVGGHHYSSASVLHYTARKMGAKLIALVPRNSFPPKIGSNSEALEILSVLSHKQYDTPLAINNSGDDFFRAFNTRRMAVQRDLTSWLSDLIFPEDVVLLSTPLTPELAGFTDWFESLSICQRPAVAVLFVLPVEFELELNVAWQRSFAKEVYSDGISRLRARSGGRYFLACHDIRLAQRLSDFNHSLDVHPVPTEVLTKDLRDDPSKEFVIGVLGQARREKGINLAIATVNLLQESAYKWVIQTAPIKFGDDSFPCKKNIKRVAHLPSNEEYRNILRSLSLILLPYDPVSYGNFRSSNMFFEALACGIPVICSETEFFVEQLDKLGCKELVFRPYTPEALASKICHVASTYPKYRRVFVEHSHQINLKEQANSFVARLIRIGQTASSLHHAAIDP